MCSMDFIHDSTIGLKFLLQRQKAYIQMEYRLLLQQ